jgi:hypothetical protein
MFEKSDGVAVRDSEQFLHERRFRMLLATDFAVEDTFVLVYVSGRVLFIVRDLLRKMREGTFDCHFPTTISFIKVGVFKIVSKENHETPSFLFLFYIMSRSAAFPP